MLNGMNYIRLNVIIYKKGLKETWIIYNSNLCCVKNAVEQGFKLDIYCVLAF